MQVLVVLAERHWADIKPESRVEIRQAIIALLDEDSPALQSWAFIGVATLAALTPGTPSSDETADFARAWSHAARKASYATISRPACHAAHALLTYGKVDPTTVIRDIQSLLQSVDIQGPPYPFDSVCALLNTFLSHARQDVRLYSMQLEDKVISWLDKWNALEGSQGKNRLDEQCPADVLPLLCNVAHLRPSQLASVSVSDLLPEGAIVERMLEEERTKPIREFLLRGTFDDAQDKPSDQSTIPPAKIIEEPSAFLEGRARRVSDILTSLLASFHDDWPADTLSNSARPAISPDRARRAIDMIVLAMGYQATLRLNDIVHAENCVQMAVKLLDKVASSLSSKAYDVSAQKLMWGGFEPLVHVQFKDLPIWPVFLKPDEQSGIRQDLLPPPTQFQGEHSIDPLTTTIWNLPNVRAVYTMSVLLLTPARRVSTVLVRRGPGYLCWRRKQPNAVGDAVSLDRQYARRRR